VVPTADGAQLILYTEMELHSLLKLAAPLRRRMQPMFQRDLNNIKARLEAAHPASATEPGQQQGGSETQTSADRPDRRQ
jgi:hypothetical protein